MRHKSVFLHRGAVTRPKWYLPTQMLLVGIALGSFACGLLVVLLTDVVESASLMPVMLPWAVSLLTTMASGLVELIVRTRRGFEQ